MTGQRAWEDKQRCKLTDIEKYHKPGIPPESEGLNSFLRGIAEAGNHESEGEFTVSLEKALDKLEKFQLTDANLFILNLVSAAVLLRATFFKVKYQPDHDLVEFDGDQLSMEELETLWVSKEPALGELSIALSAARALSYQELLFESDGGVRWQAGAKPDFFEAGSKGNSLTLVHRRSTTEKLIEKVRGTPVPLRPDFDFRRTLRRQHKFSGSPFACLVLQTDGSSHAAYKSGWGESSWGSKNADERRIQCYRGFLREFLG